MFKKKITLALALALMANVPAYATPTNLIAPTTAPVLIEQQYAELTGQIVEIKDQQIVVSTNGSANPMDTIVLNVSSDTKFDKCTYSNLTIGNTIKVRHSLAMTRSLPPQTAAYSISLVKEANQTFTYNGTVKEITHYKNTTMVRVATDNSKEMNSEIIFNVSNDTKFIGGKLTDLKIGSTLTLTYGMVMTMSLPPQTSALSITFDKAINSTGSIEGTITHVSDMKDFVLLRVVGKTEGKSKPAAQSILLIVTKNTELDDCNLKDFKPGKKIEAEFKSLETLSKLSIAEATEIELD